MEKKLLILIMILAAALFYPCHAEDISTRTVAELIENGKMLDGSEVSMTVEMIGDLMSRGAYSWVNGLDSTGAMGLWIPFEQASEIKVLGNGKYKGDTVRIRGVFHRACQEHGGDMDIHVSALTIVEHGHMVINEIPEAKIISFVLLTASCFVVVGLYQKVRLS